MTANQQPPAREQRPPLAAVACALCGHPVATMARISPSLAGGMCTRDTCVKDSRNGKPRQVYTFNRLVHEL